MTRLHVPPRPRLAAMAVTAAAAATALTGVAAGPAQSVPLDPGCTTATQVQVGDLTVGEAVNGLTVTQGTDPATGAFTGTVQGVRCLPAA